MRAKSSNPISYSQKPSKTSMIFLAFGQLIQALFEGGIPETIFALITLALAGVCLITVFKNSQLAGTLLANKSLSSTKNLSTGNVVIAALLITPVQFLFNLIPGMNVFTEFPLPYTYPSIYLPIFGLLMLALTIKSKLATQVRCLSE